MSNEIMPIDLNVLEAVTGGTHRGGGHGNDALLSDVSNLASQLKDVTNKTSGFSSTTLLLLMVVALQRNNNPYSQTNVVYYQRGGRWW